LFSTGMTKTCVRKIAINLEVDEEILQLLEVP
jgi:hypothetical protein